MIYSTHSLYSHCRIFVVVILAQGAVPPPPDGARAAADQQDDRRRADGEEQHCQQHRHQLVLCNNAQWAAVASLSMGHRKKCL